MTVRINLGCGNVYLRGYINVDWQGKCDINCDLSKEVPFPENYADEILLDNVLEHIPRDRIFWFLDELWRVCKPTGVIHIYVPHCTSPFAYGHLAHYNYFHSRSMDIMNVDAKGIGGFEYYNKARFKVKTRLLMFHHNYYNLHFLSTLNPLVNWAFNFSNLWKYLMEKIWLPGFEEIFYELTPVKEDKE